MTIAEDYFADTGETVGQACIRLHKEGKNIEFARLRCGYSSTSDLRLYLRRRGLVCPWPITNSSQKRGKPETKVTDAVMEKYAALRWQKVSAPEAAKQVGQKLASIRSAIQRRRRDIKLPRWSK